MLTYVINLPERSDRLAALRRVWGHDFTVHPGVRARTPREGCLRAHRILWQRLAGSEQDVLVLEDDAVPLAPLWVPHDLPEDWDLLMLGGHHVRPPTPVRPDLVRCVDTSRTHAYLVRAGRAGRLLAATAPTRPDQHVSTLLRMAMYHRTVNCYAVNPWQVGQAAGYSDVSTKATR
jgi:hypothetical protein